MSNQPCVYSFDRKSKKFTAEIAESAEKIKLTADLRRWTLIFTHLLLRVLTSLHSFLCGRYQILVIASRVLAKQSSFSNSAQLIFWSVVQLSGLEIPTKSTGLLLGHPTPPSQSDSFTDCQDTLLPKLSVYI